MAIGASLRLLSDGRNRAQPFEIFRNSPSEPSKASGDVYEGKVHIYHVRLVGLNSNHCRIDLASCSTVDCAYRPIESNGVQCEAVSDWNSLYMTTSPILVIRSRCNSM